MTDLIERLQAAAAEAIANERPSLEHRPWELRSIALEIEMSSSGAILDATCSVTRRYVYRPREEPPS
jgi:hypothetical protein